MSTTLKEVEAIPASYPATPTGLSAAAAALDPDMIWQRIESYTAHRWTSRAVVWTVEGCGDWEPPLTPATITTTEIWENHSWAAVVLDPSATQGSVLPGEGPYRFTGTVGSGTPPAAVSEAFRRLAEYLADGSEMVAGSSSLSINIGGDLERSFDRSPAWLAKAMQYSGAADLLRPYRRA